MLAHWQNDVSNNPVISNFSTTWTVLDAPSNYDSQLIFIYNALHSDDLDVLILPVLQYGATPAGGGEYWSILSCFLVGEYTYYSSPVPVSSGTLLTGMMIMTDFYNDHDTETTTYYWNLMFLGYPDIALNILTTKELTNALEVVEARRITGDSDLPTETTKTKSIYLQTGSYCPSLSWSDTTAIVQVVIDGSINGQVDMPYPTL